MTPPDSTLAETARYIIARERKQANQCVAAMQSELDVLMRWKDDPGGLNAHNLDGIIRLAEDAKRFLTRVAMLEELKP